LIHNLEDAANKKEIRPFSLLNYSFKIFDKLLTIRVENFCQRLIAKEQSAFIRGRCILESVVVAHEIAHGVHKSKELGVAIKLDYEKVMIELTLTFTLKFGG
jgi:hypothetical protein